MCPVLPTEKAKDVCLSMIDMFNSIPAFSSLLLKGKGKHFGALICSDGTILYAYSGYSSAFDSLASLCPYEFVASCAPSSALSASSFVTLHSLYNFCNFKGEHFSLSSLGPGFATGTGDCCEIKLLSHCYSLGKKPSSMACFFYGNGSFGHKEFTTPCDSRCKKILPYIIGLDIVYLDKDIVVVNKPAGLLSIEGKGPDKMDCVASRVRSFFGPTSYGCIDQPCIHRLDQATSGLLVLGLTSQAHDTLSLAFEKREVVKEYEALVEGVFDSHCGEFKLRQRLDTENRPLQIVDEVNGKKAITVWERIGTVHKDGKNYTRLLLKPLTGRTHQLRLACSHFGHPIVGDNLYGSYPEGSKLNLVARHLEFVHPVTGENLSFNIKANLN